MPESTPFPAAVAVTPRRPPSAADVADHYDELDRAYREIWGEHVHHGYWRTGAETAAEAAEALVELVAERLELRPGMRLCDIGCGYGAAAEYIAARGRVDVTGFTISGQQARIAAARKSVVILHRDWLDNGLADDSFDGAYAIESSEHMTDKAAFFREAWRVLRPGGRLVVCAWLAGPEPKAWAVRHLLEPICREGRLPGMGSRVDYEALARQAGFSPAGYEDLTAKVQRTWWICARRIAKKLVTDGYYWRLITSAQTRNRVFLLTIPRLIVALRTGAMRYGVFVWVKAPS